MGLSVEVWVCVVLDFFHLGPLIFLDICSLGLLGLDMQVSNLGLSNDLS